MPSCMYIFIYSAAHLLGADAFLTERVSGFLHARISTISAGGGLPVSRSTPICKGGRPAGMGTDAHESAAAG